MTKEEIEEQLLSLSEEDDSYKAVLKAYKIGVKIGKLSMKCKEDIDNPYNIDYKRQTKIEF